MRTTEFYEPPTLTEVGDFSRTTLGRLGWGFDSHWLCIMYC
ncbi:lasso RiPP family leader peptide-containing protein [Actinomadura kijaniata]|nr:lasso RiPP family leader peptide-containing protein [Actinomadura kijaniata]